MGAFLSIVFLGVICCIIFGIIDAWKESQLTPEEREIRRRHEEEERHQEYLASLERRHHEEQLRLQAEAQKKAQRSSLMGIAGKVATGVIVSSLTGRHHNRRH